MIKIAIKYSLRWARRLLQQYIRPQELKTIRGSCPGLKPSFLENDIVESFDAMLSEFTITSFIGIPENEKEMCE